MRVVAAKFAGQPEASAALELVRRVLRPKDVAVAPLAHPGEAPTGDALLAGRFPDEQAAVAVELVKRAGGEIVADIDEKWTGLNSAPARPGSSGRQVATGYASQGRYLFD